VDVGLADEDVVLTSKVLVWASEDDVIWIEDDVTADETADDDAATELESRADDVGRGRQVLRFTGLLDCAMTAVAVSAAGPRAAMAWWRAWRLLWTSATTLPARRARRTTGLRVESMADDDGGKGAAGGIY
jgi:hypothetical protein